MAIVMGLCVGIDPPAAKSADSAAPKLRYNFQVDREYPYEIEIHAKIMEEKIDRKGELIYKVLSTNDDQAVLKTSGSAAGQLGQMGRMPFPRMGPPRFMHGAPAGTTVNTFTPVRFTTVSRSVVAESWRIETVGIDGDDMVICPDDPSATVHRVIMW